jgi:hypothetical protein
MLFVSHNVTRKALKSLQGLGGVYGLVVPCDEVQFPGALVGHFTGDKPFRVVLLKATKGCRKQRMRKDEKDELQTSHNVDGPTGAGYGVQLTWDVPECTHNGILEVHVCWHEQVYQAHVEFGKKEFWGSSSTQLKYQ